MWYYYAIHNTENILFSCEIGHDKDKVKTGHFPLNRTKNKVQIRTDLFLISGDNQTPGNLKIICGI